MRDTEKAKGTAGEKEKEAKNERIEKARKKGLQVRKRN